MDKRDFYCYKSGFEKEMIGKFLTFKTVLKICY